MVNVRMSGTVRSLVGFLGIAVIVGVLIQGLMDLRPDVAETVTAILTYPAGPLAELEKACA